VNRLLAVLWLLCLLLSSSVQAATTIRGGTVPPDGRFRFVDEPRSPSQPTLGVALGGGAAWGVAHLGFLEGMQRDGLYVDRISGTSIGAVVGACLAAGYSVADVQEILRRQDPGPGDVSQGRRDLQRAYVTDPVAPHTALVRWGKTVHGDPIGRSGVFPDQSIYAMLARYLGRADAQIDGDLERLGISFRAVSSDLVSGEAYAPRHGSLVQLVRASLGLPIFGQVEIEGRRLVDGGAVQQVPIPTARAMGAEVVVGVRLSADGSRLDPHKKNGGFLSAARRYDQIAVAKLRQRVLREADHVAEVLLGDLPLGDARGVVDELLDAGREGWARNREEVYRLLEAEVGGATFMLEGIEASEANEAALAVELASRLLPDGTRKRWSGLRIEVALSALMRSHDLVAAELRVADDGGATLVVRREPVVRDLELETGPRLREYFTDLDVAGNSNRRATIREVLSRISDARHDGLLFAGLTELQWDDTTQSLRVVVEDGELRRLTMDDGKSSRSVPKWVQTVEGQVGQIEPVQTALAFAEDRQYINEPRIRQADEEDGYGLQVEIKPDSRWEIAASSGFADSMGAYAWARLDLPRFNESASWGTSFTWGGAREGHFLTWDLGPQYREGWAPFVRFQAARAELLLYSGEGHRAGSTPFDASRGAVGARFESERFGILELSGELRYVSSAAFPNAPDAGAGHEGIDWGVRMDWRGDWPGIPSHTGRGLSWEVAAHAPLGGERRASYFHGDLVFSTPLERNRRWAFVAASRLALSEQQEPLPADRWMDAGSWWEAPMLAPGRSRARSLARLSLIFSRRFATPIGIPFYLSGSVAAWQLDDDRLDLQLDDRGIGASLFVELKAWRLGSIFFGVAEGDQAGDHWYFLIGPSRPTWP